MPVALLAGPFARLAASQANVADIVAEARRALGGQQKLDSIQTFSAEGSFRRLMGQRQLEGSLEVVAQRPDKMRRIEELAIGGMTGAPTVERVMTLNGDRGWDASNQRGGGGGAVMMMRMGPGPGGPGGGGPGGHAEGGGPDAPPTQSPNPDQVARFRGRMLKQELDRWMFALFVSSSQTIAHAGSAQAPDGTADVLEIKDDRGQPVRLFVDQQTHLPLMLTFQTVRPRVMTVGPGGPGSGQRPDPEAVRRQIEAQDPPPPVTATLRFSDYRAVDGVLLPHRIEQSIGDEATEEWIVEKFRLNPSVKADIFEKK